MANWGDFHQISGAGWSVFWRIPKAKGGGLELWWADFQGKRVLWKGSQPFAIVPYHHPLQPVQNPEPPPPQFTFKDGLGEQCGGAAFTALKWWAPNAGNTSSAYAAIDTEAVRIDSEPETPFDAASLRINAKFQCGWYQYVHRWEFNSYGEIHVDLGMGGTLHPRNRGKAHVHHMYFRVDLDIDGFQSDVFEQFAHRDFDDNGLGDKWTIQSQQGKFRLDPASARKFRVRDLTSTLAPGVEPRGYEIEIPAQASVDSQSTADVWATVYRGDTVEQGEEVGRINCDDRELDQMATGALDTKNGSDIVTWFVVRHHHEPRDTGEERDFLPYHYEGFHIVPRAFTNLKSGGSG